MKRRTFVTASASAGLYAETPAGAPGSSFFQLLYFYMRTGTQVDRTTQYLSGVFLPAAQRAGLEPVGFFSPIVGERSPFILSLASYPSLAAMDTIHHKFADDKEFQKGFDAYSDIPDPPYVRMESSLLQAFSGMPSLQVPAGDGKRPA